MIPQIAFNGGYYARCRTTPPICIQRTVAKKGENQDDGSGRDTPTPTPEESCSNAMEVARIEPHLNGLETWRVNTMYCTISPILDRIHVNQELDVEIGIEGAESLEATVVIERVLGSAGDAQFMDGSHSKSVTLPATLRIKGVQNSDEFNNVALNIISSGVEIGTEDFYIATLPHNFAFVLDSKPSPTQPAYCTEGDIFIPPDFIHVYQIDTLFSYESESGVLTDLINVKLREVVLLEQRDEMFTDNDPIMTPIYYEFYAQTSATPIPEQSPIAYQREDNIRMFLNYIQLPLTSVGSRKSLIRFQSRCETMPINTWVDVGPTPYHHEWQIESVQTPDLYQLRIKADNIQDAECVFFLPTVTPVPTPEFTPTPGPKKI